MRSADSRTRKSPPFLLSLLVWLLPPSRTKNRLLRLLGNDIDDTAVLGPNLVLGCGRFSVGAGSQIDPFNLFKGLSRIQVGTLCRIGRYTQFTAAPAYQEFSDRAGSLIVQDESVITNRHYFDCSGQIVLEKHSAIGGIRTVLQSHEFDLEKCTATVGVIRIGSFTMTASHCVLLKDSRLAAGSVYAAGSVVRRTSRRAVLKPGLYAGVPATFRVEMPEQAWHTNYDVVRGVEPFDDSSFEKLDD